MTPGRDAAPGSEPGASAKTSVQLEGYTPTRDAACRTPIRLRDSLGMLVGSYVRRAQVRAALLAADGVGGSASEQRLIATYDALVEAESRGGSA